MICRECITYVICRTQLKEYLKYYKSKESSPLYFSLVRAISNLIDERKCDTLNQGQGYLQILKDLDLWDYYPLWK